MKIHEVKVVLDKEAFEPGTKVTGKLVVRTNNETWGNLGRAYVRFYDRLNIEWVEEEIMVGDTKRVYSNFQRPYEINHEVLFDTKQVVFTGKEGDVCIFAYPLEFQLPDKLLGTHNVKSAKNQYFIKAYLTHDASVAEHYKQGVNVFDEFFKSLNHTYVKQEVIVKNKVLEIVPELCDKHTFEAKSANLKVTVVLQKLTYKRDETVQLHLNIQHADDTNKSKLSLHKIGFKLFQVVKLTSKTPSERVRLFEHLLSHSSRKSVHQNNANGIVIEEFVQIPTEIPSSSSRSDIESTKRNPIRVNYKIRLEFWKSLFYDELDINIPLLVDPLA